VADGMGGHHAGDVASSTLVEALSAVAPSRDISEFARRTAQAVQDVNSRLFRMAQDSGEADQVIGSTAVVLLAVGSRCVFLWAGDSRLYRYRNERLEQLTQDHSLFEDFARSGVLTPTQLAESGRCDTITRAVGAAETLALEQGECDAQVGDLYLLCSDGVDKELACDEIQSIIRTTPVEAIAAALIEQAEERGARDNVTAIIAGLLPSPP
jgi:serine/threonine protein phosphatase PrpC